ncbi:MAG: helix-turn-helix transcriptional regulator [Chlamydiae bacterium]|nr:helix-turn-helix transcriptional regulator [Chlamydiota bacterium]
MSVRTRTHHIRRVKKTTLQNKEQTYNWRDVYAKKLEHDSESGIYLRGVRNREGLTQVQLAKKLGISQHHISEMEHGKRLIGKKMAKRLSKVLKAEYRMFL